MATSDRVFERNVLAATEAAERVLNALAAGERDKVADIPDMLSVVTERVVRLLRSGAEIRDLNRYAKQIARNVFNDRGRSQARRPKRLDDELARSKPPLLRKIDGDVSLTPASLVVKKHDERRHAADIRAARASLSPLENAIIELRFEQGLSSAEVAERLGYKTAAVVDTITSRIRRKLQQQLPMSLIEPLLARPKPAPARPQRRVGR